MVKKNNNQTQEAAIIDEESFKEKIYIIRGQKTILDYDLALMYGYKTKELKSLVQKNKDSFPSDMMFQLTKAEYDFLISQYMANSSDDYSATQDLDKNSDNAKNMPYAFTEQGVYMLMTVLEGKLADKRNLAIIRLFTKIKDYLFKTNCIIRYSELESIDNKLSKIEKDQKEIRSQLIDVIDIICLSNQKSALSNSKIQ